MCMTIYTEHTETKITILTYGFWGLPQLLL